MSASAAWRHARLGVFLAGGVLLVAGLAMRLSNWPRGQTPWAWGVLGAAVYLAAHGVRAARLALLIGDDRVPLRRVLQAHVFAAGVSLMIPFKLGELYRVFEIGRVVGSPVRALLIVWLERVLDLVAVASVLVIGLLWYPRILPFFLGPVLATVAALVVTFVIFFALPENIGALKMYIIRRYNSIAALSVLRVLHALQGMIRQAPMLIRGRRASVAVLTLAIWLLEIVALGLFLPAAAGLSRAMLVAVAFIFSSALPGGQAGLSRIVGELGGEQGAGSVGGVGDIGAAVAVYQPWVFIPLIAGALVVFITLARRRWAEAGLGRAPIFGTLAEAPA